MKKDSAGFWESADTRYKTLMTKLVSRIAGGDFAPDANISGAILAKKNFQTT